MFSNRVMAKIAYYIYTYIGCSCLTRENTDFSEIEIIQLQYNKFMNIAYKLQTYSISYKPLKSQHFLTLYVSLAKIGQRV